MNPLYVKFNIQDPFSSHSLPVNSQMGYHRRPGHAKTVSSPKADIIHEEP